MLLCTTTTLQFTSTLLAWDLRSGIVVSPSMINSSLSGMSIQNTNVSTRYPIPPYWQCNPATFQSFAEYQESIPVREGPEANSVRDTSMIHRALLPLPDHTSRTAVKEYTGKASVLDSRMVCIRPTMHTEYSLGYTNSTGWLLNGTFAPFVWIKGLVLESLFAMPQDSLNHGLFSYTMSADNITVVNLTYAQQLPLHATDNDDEWTVREKLLVFEPGLVSTINPRFDQITPENVTRWAYESPEGDLFSSSKYNISSMALVNSLSYYIKGDPIKLLTGRSHIMMNVSHGPLIWEPKRIYSPRQAGFARQLNITTRSRVLYTMHDTINPLIVKPQNEWLVFTMPQAPLFRVAITPCFDPFVSLNAKITATTSMPIEEPDFTWDVSAQVAGTVRLRRQIGCLDHATPNTSSRGLLTLLTSPADLRKQLNGSI